MNDYLIICWRFDIGSPILETVCKTVVLVLGFTLNELTIIKVRRNNAIMTKALSNNLSFFIGA